MRRVVSLWFPHWPTDRLRRQRTRQQADATASREAALVTAMHDGRRRVIAAVDGMASALGLRPGLAIAQALAMVPGLNVAEADLVGDAEALHRLALWCHRYTPLVSACAPDGLWLDIGGGAHLFGGEQAMLARLLDRLARDGLQARAAVADTPAGAHALARHGRQPLAIIPPDGQFAATAPLPVACLRLPADLNTTLHRLGFEQVGHLARLPRAVLARRFGPVPGLRLDQIQGLAPEPLAPLLPEQALHRREAFLDPLLTAEALSIAIARLVVPLCAEMECGGLGARRLDLLFERIDGHVVALRVGTVQPSRDATHLVRLLTERLDTVDPGPGIEAMHLVLPLTEELRWEQQDSGAVPQQPARLIDRLINRLGAERVYRAAPVETPIPERLAGKRSGLTTKKPAPRPPGSIRPPQAAVTPPDPARPGPVLKLVASTPEPLSGPIEQRQAHRSLHLVPAPRPEEAQEPRVVPAWKRPQNRHRRLPMGLTDTNGVLDKDTWPSALKPPARLLAPPRPISAIAGLPNQAPATFTWRRRHRVLRSEGPERIHETWWQGDHESDAIRDYFEVEVEGGQRFWLFRRGNGLDLRAGDLTWYLHGVF